MDDLLIAARYQDVGHFLAQRLSLGNGGKVLLALGIGVGDEVGIRKLLGLAEHGRATRMSSSNANW